MTEYFETSGIFRRFSDLTRRRFQQFSVSFPTLNQSQKLHYLGTNLCSSGLQPTTLPLRHAHFIKSWVRQYIRSLLTFVNTVFFFVSTVLNFVSTFLRQYSDHLRQCMLFFVSTVLNFVRTGFFFVSTGLTLARISTMFTDFRIWSVSSKR